MGDVHTLSPSGAWSKPSRGIRMREKRADFVAGCLGGRVVAVGGLGNARSRRMAMFPSLTFVAHQLPSWAGWLCKPWGYCNTLCIMSLLCPPMLGAATQSACTELICSCAVYHAHTTHTSSAPLHRAAALHSSPESWGKVSAVSQQQDAVGRNLVSATASPLSAARLIQSRTSCCRARGGDGEDKWCWLDPCGMALL